MAVMYDGSGVRGTENGIQLTNSVQTVALQAWLIPKEPRCKKHPRFGVCNGAPVAVDLALRLRDERLRYLRNSHKCLQDSRPRGRAMGLPCASLAVNSGAKCRLRRAVTGTHDRIDRLVAVALLGRLLKTQAYAA